MTYTPEEVGVLNAKIERLRAALEKIAHAAGEFPPPEQRDIAAALLFCEQTAKAALDVPLSVRTERS